MSEKLRVLYLGNGRATAESAAAGLEAERPDLSIEPLATDGVPTGLDGRDVDCVVCEGTDDATLTLARLEAVREAYPDTFLVLYADDADPELVRDAYAAGVDDYVSATGEGALVALAHGIAANATGGRRGDGSAGAESHFEALARTASDAIVTIDAESRIRFANPAVEEVLGYDPDELIGEPLTTVMSPDLAGRHRRGIRRYLDTGERRIDWDYVELPARRDDGEEVLLGLSFSEFSVGGDRFFTGVLRDVTKLRHLETELAESLERVTDAFLSVDSEWRFTYLNESAEDLLERNQGELIGRNLWDEFGEAVDTSFEDEYREAMATQEPVAFEEYYSPLETWFAVKAYPSETGLSVYFRDVSDRKEREQQFEQYAAILETLWDGVYALDPEERFVMANETFLEMTGYDREELLGRHASVVHSEAISDAAADLSDEVATDAQSNAVLELDLRRADGRTIPVESRFGPYRYDDESLARTGVVRDITERRRFEETLTSLHWSSHELLGAASADEVASIAVDAAVEVLGLPGAGVYLADGKGEALVPSVVSDYVLDMFGEMPALGPGDESIVWETYERGEMIAHDDLSRADRMHRHDTPLRSGIWLPLGEHGVLSIVSESTDEFDGRDRQLAELLAANVEAALDRVARETTLRRRERQLTRLNEMSRGLSAAADPTEVSEAVTAAEEALGLPLAAVALYDEESGRLRSAARTPALAELAGDDDPFASTDGAPWRVFLRNERLVYADDDALSVDGTALRSAIVLPLGRYGVFVGGSTAPDAFTESDVSFAEILAGNAVSALDRVDRERSLRERTNQLEEQNESLEHLRHINEVIRGISQVLIRASTREEIERTVCDMLAGAEPYRFVWIGARDPVTDEIEPRAWAGAEDGYLDEITVTADERETGQGPVGRCVRSREVQVQNDVNFDPAFERWRNVALERGYRSVVSVPLVYGEALYGVLTLYGNAPDLFTEMERNVLAELGETIGYAFNSLERKRALTSENSIEIELAVAEPDRRRLECIDRPGYEFEMDSLVRRENGVLHLFYVVRGDSVETARSIGREAADVRDVTLVAEREGGWLFSCTLTAGSFLSRLLDRGAIPESITASDGRMRTVIRIPGNAEIRPFFELFEGTFSSVELVARRERSESVTRLREYRDELTDRLTDRQREILRAAYRSGYFAWPRDTTAQDLADLFDVSQPTISRHLRRGEERTFSMLFGDEEGDE